MIWAELEQRLARALASAALDPASAPARLQLAIPADPAHGDWSTNLAMQLAKEARRPPRALAEAIAAGFELEGSPFAGVEVAGPGFLNFRYAPAFLDALPGRIVAEGARFGRSDFGRGVPILVEYVSANPTGPMNVVSARAAAVGACLVRLLEAIGHRAEGEFYVNDAGNQADLFGASVRARFLERIGTPEPFPEQGYRGGYVRDVAAALPEAEAKAALARDDGGLAWFRDHGLERMIAWQREDLDAYGARFGTWFRESTLHRDGRVAETLRALEERGMTYRAAEAEGAGEGHGAADDAGPDGPLAGGEATFLRTSAFGDDKDRVVVRRNGSPTYLLPDIAYHRDKRSRGFRHAIDLWGPDHHGYVARMKASLASLGLEPDFLEVLIVQQVNLISAGQPVKMSKRAGEFVTLRDLMDEVGADCAKFFFLMRTTSAHLDFDLDLAKQQNDDNPAFYVQYAHARIASVLRHAAERGHAAPPAGAGPVRPLEAPEEIALARKLAAFPEVVRGAAAAREPHRIPTYLAETAAVFHRFYHACRVVTDDAVRTRARLQLCDAARVVFRNGLALMGVSAPERMERAAEVAT